MPDMHVSTFFLLHALTLPGTVRTEGGIVLRILVSLFGAFELLAQRYHILGRCCLLRAFMQNASK